MGTTKQLLTYQGTPLLRFVVEKLLETQVQQVIVVLGHQALEVAEALAGLPVQLVINQLYASGQSTSLQAGLAALAEKPTPSQGVLFVLGDQPLVKQETINLLIDFHTQHGGIVAPYYLGVRGNPILFDHKFIPELSGLTGDVGAREIIARHPEYLYKLNVQDQGILQDIDTLKDYHKLTLQP
jgi:molybdenum cofactor cytidylyltransferase